METWHDRPGTNSPTVASVVSQTPTKRPFATSLDEPPAKKAKAGLDRPRPPFEKAKPVVEVPALYSDAVRKKLASTSRTGQACDRCKERKMKCDTNPLACQPCRQKNFRCYTTDRVTGQPRERGQTDRAENELQVLREQNAAYHRRYGPLEATEYQHNTQSPAPESSHERWRQSHSVVDRDRREVEPTAGLPDAQYVGWPAPSHTEALYSGPVNGTQVDILDGIIDVADFPCDAMDEYPITHFGRFNMSKASVMNTITGYQNITDPRFPSKQQAIEDANTFLLILSQFVPILHRPSFIQMVNRIYDQPSTVLQSERVQLAVVLAIVEQQMGTRNHREAAEKFEQSHYHIHYALTYYRELLRENTLSSMQALALLLVHFRNLPKPGYTWGIGHNILVKAMDSQYHRNPDKIDLPPSENNPLAKELRKRVFHSILGICVTTGCRVGRPAPWQFCHMDVPLPMAIKDSEISEAGIASPLSGSCDFWPSIQLARLLPLLEEMYSYVTTVRRSETEYVKIVERLHSKIDAWRRDWDESIRHEEKHVNLNVATLLVDGWAAEYALNLYHPSLCPSRSAEVMDRHLEICHKQAQRLLKSFHILSSKYKGVDFTWHSTVAYATGFGITLHVYHKKKARMSTAQFDNMKNEFKGWLSLMAYADLVLRTKNHLQHIFEPRVRKIEHECQDAIRATSSEQAHFSSVATTTPNAIPNRPSVKLDPSPRPSPLSLQPHKVDVRPNHSQQELAAPRYPQAQPTPSPQHWVQSAQYVPRTGSSTPTYAAFSTNAPQYPGLPTSLAPLLNDHSGGYITYPPTPNQQSEMMIYQPAHYTDSSANMMWPFITLSPQEQGPHQAPNASIKYH